MFYRYPSATGSANKLRKLDKYKRRFEEVGTAEPNYYFKVESCAIALMMRAFSNLNVSIISADIMGVLMFNPTAFSQRNENTNKMEQKL